MNEDADAELVIFTVKVLRKLSDEIDERAEELGYADRTEFVRGLLNDVTGP